MKDWLVTIAAGMAAWAVTASGVKTNSVFSIYLLFVAALCVLVANREDWRHAL